MNFHQKQDLAFFQGEDDLIYYRNTLDQALLEKLDGRPTHSFSFLHDGSSIHISHPIKVYLIKKEEYILDWPPRSPDLNPSENVFGLLAPRIYRGKTRFLV